MSHGRHIKDLKKNEDAEASLSTAAAIKRDNAALHIRHAPGLAAAESQQHGRKAHYTLVYATLASETFSRRGASPNLAHN
jgi:hypothetical protein